MARKKLLLKRKPYIIQPNSYEKGASYSMRIVLSPMCGFKVGERIYEFVRSDGVVELVPENLVDINNYT